MNEQVSGEVEGDGEMIKEELTETELKVRQINETAAEAARNAESFNMFKEEVNFLKLEIKDLVNELKFNNNKIEENKTTIKAEFLAFTDQ